MPDGLTLLSANDPAQLEACAELHEIILPHSVPVLFGRRFMTKFYFPRLLASGLVAGHLFGHEGRYVGFNLFTKYPETFLRDGIRQNFGFLLRFMPGVFLRNPAALRALPATFGNSGGFPEPDRPAGYWLTFGVLPEARSVDVGGKRIARVLVEAMFDWFRKEGFPAVEGTVERDNRPAILFYRTCGFKFEDRGLADGAKLQVRYELR